MTGGIQFYLHRVLQSYRREHFSGGTNARVNERSRTICALYIDLASFDDGAGVYRYCCRQDVENAALRQSWVLGQGSVEMKLALTAVKKSCAPPNRSLCQRRRPASLGELTEI